MLHSQEIMPQLLKEYTWVLLRLLRDTYLGLSLPKKLWAGQLIVQDLYCPPKDT